MALSFKDGTSGGNVISASNSGGVEFGSSTPSSTLSINGKNLLYGSSLNSRTLPSGAIYRATGSVTINSLYSTTVSVPPCAGFGTVSGATLVCFYSPTLFQAALLTDVANVTITSSYAVF